MSECDYLEQIKLLDLSLKTLWTTLQELKMYAKLFTSLYTLNKLLVASQMILSSKL